MDESMDSLTASTATGVEFKTKEELKQHYHSDYHRYNLKRKVAGLPMLTPEQFERRQAQEQAKLTAGHTDKQMKKLGRKEARNAKKEQRLQNKADKMQHKADRHEQRQVKIQNGEGPEEHEDMYVEDADSEWLDEEDDDDEVEILPGASLFDNEILEDWPECLSYMEAKFGFIIPHIDRVKDMEMLCSYLQIKINHCFRCLYSSKRFRSAEAVKAYMAAKGNRRFDSETFEAEFGRFYHRIAEDRKAEKQRLALVEHGAWGPDGEEGVTASGKKLVPRELAWVVKQNPKPAESHAGVLAAQAEAEQRQMRAYQQLAAFRRTAKSEMKKNDVHRQSKHIMNLQVKGNKLAKIPFECMLFGR